MSTNHSHNNIAQADVYETLSTATLLESSVCSFISVRVAPLRYVLIRFPFYFVLALALRFPSTASILASAGIA